MNDEVYVVERFGDLESEADTLGLTLTTLNGQFALNGHNVAIRLDSLSQVNGFLEGFERAKAMLDKDKLLKTLKGAIQRLVDDLWDSNEHKNPDTGETYDSIQEAMDALDECEKVGL